MLTCYDLRFPEASLILRQLGADIITYPSAFAVKTGMAHWGESSRICASWCSVLHLVKLNFPSAYRCKSRTPSASSGNRDAVLCARRSSDWIPPSYVEEQLRFSVHRRPLGYRPRQMQRQRCRSRGGAGSGQRQGEGPFSGQLLHSRVSSLLPMSFVLEYTGLRVPLSLFRIDLEHLSMVRKQMPLWEQRRFDVYNEL